MGGRINARIDDDLALKLEELSRATGKSTSAIIKAALEAYIESARTNSEVRPKLALERAGFIGCESGEPQLSQTYKQALRETMGSKT